jgi:hypothetical protein
MEIGSFPDFAFMADRQSTLYPYRFLMAYEVFNFGIKRAVNSANPKSRYNQNEMSITV